MMRVHRWLMVLVAVAASACAIAALRADEPCKELRASQEQDAAVQRAAKYVQSVVESLDIEVDKADRQRLQFRKTPLLKYSDPARAYPAAGVWRLGEKGRPEALISLQYMTGGDREVPELSYELISFTETRFEVKSPHATLPADGTAPEFKALPGVNKPAAGEKQRLIQLRALARRFAVSEKYMGDVVELRLLPQPIDRYADKEREIVDGGMFVFVYGTNPEAVLLLECDKESWRYALARVAWAELAVEFDGKEVARFEPLTGTPESGPYRTAGHAIEPAQP